MQRGFTSRPQSDGGAEPRPLLLPAAARRLAPLLEHDQRSRYQVATAWLARLLARCPERPLRILEVGPNVLHLLPQLLDPEQIEVVRCDVEVPDNADPDFVRVARGAPFPFAARQFQAVVALEVLEHMPAADRSGFVAECLRVAQVGAVFTCPQGLPEVARCERTVCDAFAARRTERHPFLSEHAEFGLPDPHAIERAIEEAGARSVSMTMTPLGDWLVGILATEPLHERDLPLRIQEAVRQFVCVRPQSRRVRMYRRVFVALHSGAVVDETPVAVEPAPEFGLDRLLNELGGLSRVHQVRFLNGLRVIARQMWRGALALRKTVRPGPAPDELAAAAARVDELRDVAERAFADRMITWAPHEAGTVWGAIRSRLICARYALRGGLMTLEDWMQRWLAYPRATLEALQPDQHLRPGPAPRRWVVESADASWLLPCNLRAGVFRIRLTLSVEHAARVTVIPDCGGDYPTAERLPIGLFAERLVLDRYLRSSRPVQALRIEITQGSGCVEFEDLIVDQPPQWMIPLAAIAGKIRRAWNRREMGAMIVRGIKSLTGGNLRDFRQRWMRGLDAHAPVDRGDPALQYRVWQYCQSLRAEDRVRLRDEAAQWAARPRVSLLTEAGPGLEVTLESLQAQLYSDWELCVAARQPDADQLAALARNESRLKICAVESAGGAALNAAWAAATGDWVGVVAPGDRLAEAALVEVLRRARAEPACDVIYTDEDRLATDGQRVEPFFKPDWSPEYFLAWPYLQNLTLVRRNVWGDGEPFRPAAGPAHAYDWLLRSTRAARHIGHIEDVLYHRATPYPLESGVAPELAAAQQKVLAAALRERGEQATVESAQVRGSMRVRRVLSGQPLISVVIPTACGQAMIRGRRTWYVLQCIETIRQLSTYPRLEIVVLDNNDMSPALEARLRPLEIRRVPFTQPFNLATKMNVGAAAARGEQLVFLNDDIEVISRDWLESMLEWSQQPEIGAVGARLLFPDDRLQHAGVTLLNGAPGHHFYRFPPTHPGYFLTNVVHRNYSAVTGACLMTRAAVFLAHGGFTADFPLNYNDVDYCLKVQQQGLRIVYTPYAELYHHESVTKSGTYDEELHRFKTRWGDRLRHDPFYNANLSTETDYSISVRRAS